MKKWPLPNLKLVDFKINLDWTERESNWYRDKESEVLYNKDDPFPFETPLGWGNRWPDIPNPDEVYPEFRLIDVNLSEPRNRCSKKSLLGYYMSWHMISVSFQNENNRPPLNSDELKRYNDSLPEENRFGIHICCNTIESYISKFSTEGLEARQIPFYLEYCTFLTLIYVIAHEWGHYRSEVLSFQIGNLVKSVTGDFDSRLAPSYLSYFVFKKQFPESNFEEVFAEWSSLKFGIFNYYMKKPAFANSISNWPQVEATVKFMLTQAISRQSRIKPYSDIRFWVDFNRITRDTVMTRLSENSPSINRSVNDNVLVNKIRSFKKGKMIDLLMHNQMQFSNDHRFNGLIKSSKLTYPIEPDSSFYHFGDDECLTTNKASGNSKNFLRLSNLKFSDPSEMYNSNVKKVIDSLKEDNNEFVSLPIKVFNEILPLDPIYFHT